MTATLLLTRPTAAAQRVRGAVEHTLRREIPTVISPLLQIEDLNVVSAPEGTPVLTSEHGARAAARLGYCGRAWCVGSRTAAVARAHGMQPVSADSDGKTLIRMIKADPPRGPLVHIRGDHVAVDIASALRAAGLTAYDCVAYRQQELPLTDAARALLHSGKPIIAPVFSPRSARLLAPQIDPDRPATRYIAISRNAADHLPGAVRIAAHPDLPAMVAAICDEYSPLKAR